MMSKEFNNIIQWNDFAKIEMRIGTVITCEVFKEVRNPAYKMTVDFGDFGFRKTSAQLTNLYRPENMIGKQVVAVMNFPPKQIANFMSECLVLGGIGENNQVTLIQPERETQNGTKIG